MNGRHIALGLAGLLLAALAGMEVYTRLPTGAAMAPLNLDPQTTRQAILIFHGAQDGGDPVLEEIAERFRSLAQLSPGTAVVNYRWDQGADDRLRAAANARRLGRELGRELAGLGELQHLRIVAHSVGAFVPDALCRQYREDGGQAWIEFTLLDPFGIGGFIDWRYGVRNHGQCADFAVAFINRDDPAPATNSPLSLAYNHDVSAGAGRDRFPRNGHYWPLRYYADFIDVAEATPGVRTHDDYPRGGLRLVRE